MAWRCWAGLLELRTTRTVVSNRSTVRIHLQNWITQLNGCVLNHLFWSLFFLKNYGTEAQHAAVFHVDEKTLRKWVWFILKGMTTLRVQFVSSVVTEI